MKLQALRKVRFKALASTMAAALLTTAVAHAAGPSGKLTLAGYMDAADGDQLMAGDYAAVIEKLAPNAAHFGEDEVAATTNLCVAYVATGQLQTARGACDEAVKTAQRDWDSLGLTERLSHTDALSVAYANRAVLSKLSGE
jgi:hypothetical protein